MTVWSRAPLPIALAWDMGEEKNFIVTKRSDVRVDSHAS